MAISPIRPKQTRPGGVPALKPKRPTPAKAAATEAKPEKPASPALPEALHQKLLGIRAALNERVLERHSETDGILLTMLSGLSLLFVGDVGTAKTSHIRLASDLFGLSTFDILLSETTKPDQIFGPVDVPALAKGKQVMKTDGYAPTSEVLFFDEIFKANSVVLNPLLWLINEHRFRNGDLGIQQCPTMAVFAASNELPQDSVLKAVYDRFVLRYEVTYLKDSENQHLMVQNFLSGGSKLTQSLTKDEVGQLREAVRAVVVPRAVVDLVLKIRQQVQSACGTSISDRRLNNVFRLIQAHAVMRNHSIADDADVQVVAHAFWDKPSQQPRVQAICASYAAPSVVDLLTFDELSTQVIETAMKTGQITQAMSRLDKLIAQVDQSSTAAIQAVNRIRERRAKLAAIQSQRERFIVTKVVTNANVRFKLNQTSASVWTTTQLRAAGFRLKRKLGYWYYEGTESGLEARVMDKLKVKVDLRVIVADVGDDTRGKRKAEAAPRRTGLKKKLSASTPVKKIGLRKGLKNGTRS